MIPNTLEEWDFKSIRKLVHDGYYESDKFEFKIGLPYEKDEGGKIRLEKTVCAFANTEGGFLIFGIDDDRQKSVKERITGVRFSKDFAREFGDMILNIEPRIYYEFRQPSCKIHGSGNVIPIAKIPQSSERPHRTSKGEFYYRTNRGNLPMNYQQIKNSFLSEEQLRQKLRLLFIELVANRDRALLALRSLRSRQSYSLVTFDSNILSTLLVDVFPLIINDIPLIRLLMPIRTNIEIINNEIKIVHSETTIRYPGYKERIEYHNVSIIKNINILVPLFNELIKILEKNYGLHDFLDDLKKRE